MQTNAEKQQTPTEADLAAAMKIARPFLSFSQFRIMANLVKGEEGEFFARKFVEFADTVTAMPKSYDTDGQGDDAVVHLHYFFRGSDWYITERDREGKGTEQAYGHTILNGDIEMAETGYVCLDEILQHNVELDLHWKPRTLGEIKHELHARFYGEPESAPAVPSCAIENVCDALEKAGWEVKRFDEGSRVFLVERGGLSLFGTHGDSEPYLLMSRADGETLPLPSINLTGNTLEGVLAAVEQQVTQTTGASPDYAEEDASMIDMGMKG